MHYLIKTKGLPVFKLSVLSSIWLFTLLATAHDGHHTEHAWHACSIKKQGDSCSYVMKTNQFYEGSCQEIAEGLMCVRSKPIRTLSEAELELQLPVHNNDLIKVPEDSVLKVDHDGNSTTKTNDKS